MSEQSSNQSLRDALNVTPVLAFISTAREAVVKVQKSIPPAEDHKKGDDSSAPDVVNCCPGFLSLLRSAGWRVSTGGGVTGIAATPEKREVEAGGCSTLCFGRRGSTSKDITGTYRGADGAGAAANIREDRAGEKGTSTGGGNPAAATGPGDGDNTTTSQVEVNCSSGRPDSADKKGASSQQDNGHAVNNQGDDTKVNEDITTQNSTTQNSTRRFEGENLKVFTQSEKVLRDLDYIKSQISKFNGMGSHFQDFPKHAGQLDQALDGKNKAADFPAHAVHLELQSLADKVKGVKNQMPGHKASATNTEAGHQVVKKMAFNAYHLLDRKPIPGMKEKMQGMSCFQEFFEDFKRAYEGLDEQSSRCLLCFSIFPENAVVHKKLLVYWWIGEGLVDGNETANDLVGGNGTANDLVGRNKTANEVLTALCSKGFIKPVLRNRKLFGFEMDPLVRFVVIIIAERLKFFCFDPMGVPTADCSPSHRVCLVKNIEENFSRMELTRENDSESNKDKDRKIDQLRTLFNVNDPYPDFKLEWFSKLKMLEVLYLGGWQGSKGQHIEVEGTEFLKALKSMKSLKFLSLQGISRITDLPDSLCALSNLKILDLNACHHLESLPKKLEQFKNLTHLDISECYLLDHIPKGLGQLVKLRVLKGFVIGSIDKDSCTLDELKGLTKLEKLSITSSRDNFPSENEVTILKGFEDLKKLTISWGGKSSKAGSRNEPVGTASSTGKEKGDKESAAQTKEGGEGKFSEEKKGDKRNIPEQNKGDKVKSVEQKKGDEGSVRERKESNERGLEQKGHKEIEADKKSEDKEVSKEQQGDRESSAEQEKALKGKGTEKKRVSIVEPKVPGETTDQIDDKGNFAGQKKGNRGDRVEQDNISPRSPHARQSQQSAQPAMRAKLTQTMSRLSRMSSKLGVPTAVLPTPVAPSRLEKLELQCCPLTKAPDWMVKGELKPSKKLYIRGGNLRTLKDGQGNPENWHVKILCLKYLADLEMDWKEFQKSFPDAVYLEKSRCPKLTFFPCNSSGMWINRKSEHLDEVRKDLSWSFLT